MDSEEIEQYMMYFNPETINHFNRTDEEKDTLISIFCEWNSSVRVSDLCERWVKVRPESSLEHLTLLVWNCECLSTHMTGPFLFFSLRVCLMNFLLIQSEKCGGVDCIDCEVKRM